VEQTLLALRVFLIHSLTPNVCIGVSVIAKEAFGPTPAYWILGLAEKVVNDGSLHTIAPLAGVTDSPPTNRRHSQVRDRPEW
jgi:hypothetical protein